MSFIDPTGKTEEDFNEKYSRISTEIEQGANIEEIDCDITDLAIAIRYELSTDKTKIQDLISKSELKLDNVSLAGYVAITMASDTFSKEFKLSEQLGGQDRVCKYLVDNISEETQTTDQLGYLVAVYDLIARTGLHSYLGDVKKDIFPIATSVFNNQNAKTWEDENKDLYHGIVGCTLQTLYALYTERADLDLASDLNIDKDQLNSITEQLRRVPPTLVMQYAGDFINAIESDTMYKDLGEKFLTLWSEKRSE